MKLLLIFSILTFYVSCTMRMPKDVDNFRIIVTDTSLIHSKYNELEQSKEKAEEFNLPKIYNGVDSFELRIWTSWMGSPDFLTIVRFSKDRWVRHSYAYFESDKVIDSIQITKRNLQGDMSKLVSYFTKDEVLNLPSQYAIPEFQDNVADGQLCFIEIATNKFYKALDYHCPEHFSDPYNIRFMGIMDFLKSYSIIYTPWCSPHK